LIVIRFHQVCNRLMALQSPI